MRSLAALVALASLLSACGSGPCQCTDCKAYVTCWEVVGGMKGALDSTYGPMGTCWTTTQAAADRCVVDCREGVKVLQRAYPDAGCFDR